MHYLYELKNKINGRAYIGRTVNPSDRYKRHIRELKKGTHHCIFLQREWNKYNYTESDYSTRINTVGSKAKP